MYYDELFCIYVILLRNLFDHHQRGFTETINSDYETKLSSAGLIYKHYGKEVLKQLLQENDDDVLELLYWKIYRVCLDFWNFILDEFLIFLDIFRELFKKLMQLIMELINLMVKNVIRLILILVPELEDLIHLGKKMHLMKKEWNNLTKLLK